MRAKPHEKPTPPAGERGGAGEMDQWLSDSPSTAFAIRQAQRLLESNVEWAAGRIGERGFAVAIDTQRRILEAAIEVQDSATFELLMDATARAEAAIVRALAVCEVAGHA